MNTLKYIQEKFQVDLDQKLPIRLPIGRNKGLTGLFTELGFKIGAEIGVDGGEYSNYICYYMRKNKPKLFLIDPYEVYGVFPWKGMKAHLDFHYEKAKRRLRKYNCEFILKTSMEAVKDFKDNSLDFVYIDGDHTFKYVVNDIAEWSKKVKPGGIISGDDYFTDLELKKKYVWGKIDTYTNRLKQCQVKDVLVGWTLANRIKPWFILNDTSWFWIK